MKSTYTNSLAHTTFECKYHIVLEDLMKKMKKETIKQKLLHWDDTVIMIDTKRSCLRFYGTDKLAMYTAHSQNKDGLDKDGILNVLPEETVVEYDHNKVNYKE